VRPPARPGLLPDGVIIELSYTCRVLTLGSAGMADGSYCADAPGNCNRSIGIAIQSPQAETGGLKPSEENMPIRVDNPPAGGVKYVFVGGIYDGQVLLFDRTHYATPQPHSWFWCEWRNSGGGQVGYQFLRRSEQSQEAYRRDREHPIEFDENGKMKWQGGEKPNPPHIYEITEREEVDDGLVLTCTYQGQKTDFVIQAWRPKDDAASEEPPTDVG